MVSYKHHSDSAMDYCFKALYMLLLLFSGLLCVLMWSWLYKGADGKQQLETCRRMLTIETVTEAFTGYRYCLNVSQAFNCKAHAFYLVILLKLLQSIINYAYLQNLRILNIITILSVAMNQFKVLDLISNQMHLSFVWLQHARLAWHEPLNSYTVLDLTQ